MKSRSNSKPNTWVGAEARSTVRSESSNKSAIKTGITRQQERIAHLKDRFGWKAFVTNASQERLSLQAALLCYRNEYRVERIFHRLKSRLNIAPLFVKRDDQIEGLTYLLTLGGVYPYF